MVGLSHPVVIHICPLTLRVLNLDWWHLGILDFTLLQRTSGSKRFPPSYCNPILYLGAVYEYLPIYEFGGIALAGTLAVRSCVRPCLFHTFHVPG